MQLHYDNLAGPAGNEDEALGALPSYAHRAPLSEGTGLHRRRRQRATPGAEQAERRWSLEVRSYEAEHVTALWQPGLPSRLAPGAHRRGPWVKPLLAVIDDHSRLICHLQWYLDETAETLVHGLVRRCRSAGCPGP